MFTSKSPRGTGSRQQTTSRMLIVLLAIVACFGTLAERAGADDPSLPSGHGITGKDGVLMMLVPGGEFWYGGDYRRDRQRLSLPAFYMDKYEVTTKLYATFVQATGREHPYAWNYQVALVGSEDRPVVHVTWYDADAYCRHYGKRLPTEQEWEKSAAGTDGLKYPWGNDEPTNRYALFGKSSSVAEDSYRIHATVGSYEAGASPYGVQDLAGNVSEWTSSDYSDLNDGKILGKVIRGGSAFDTARGITSRERIYSSNLGGIGGLDTGFRCAQLVVVAASTDAQSPREQLQQMTSQLRTNPTVKVLREKIIKLGAEIKPSSAVPEEAIRYEGRAQFAFKNAQSKEQFLDAAKEYEKAVVAAPWVLGYYSDLCTIYEKADKFETAKRQCEFYLTGLSDPEEMTDVKRRIAGLEFGIEKDLSADTQALIKFTQFLRTIEGTTYRSVLLPSGGYIEAQVQAESFYTKAPYTLHVYNVYGGHRKLVAQRVWDQFWYKPDDAYWYQLPIGFEPSAYCNDKGVGCYGRGTFSLNVDTITISIMNRDGTSKAPFIGTEVILRR